MISFLHLKPGVGEKTKLLPNVAAVGDKSGVFWVFFPTGVVSPRAFYSCCVHHSHSYGASGTFITGSASISTIHFQQMHKKVFLLSEQAFPVNFNNLLLPLSFDVEVKELNRRQTITPNREKL